MLYYVMFDDCKRGSTVLATTNFRGWQRRRARGVVVVGVL